MKGVEDSVSKAPEGAQVVKPSHATLGVRERQIVLIFGDTITVNAAGVVALMLWALRAQAPFGRGFVLARAGWLVVLTIAWIALAWIFQLYDVTVAGRNGGWPPRLLAIGGFELLIYLAIYFVAPLGRLPRFFYLTHLVLSLSSLAAWRWACVRILSSPRFRRRVLVVGAGWAGSTIAEAIQERLAGYYELLGFVDDDSAKEAGIVAGMPVLSTSTDLVTLVQERGVSEIVLAITNGISGNLLRALLDCQEQGIAITPMPILYERITGRVPVQHIGDNWYVALPLDHPSTGALYPVAKRLLDVLVATVGLVLFTLLFPLVALAIKMDSPGPVFYRQTRVGRGGKVFPVVKLRTMFVDAEKGEAIWASKNDQRITRVGRFLRKIRLDEFPQFVNVLRGEMSVVGPRPERPELVAELERQIPFYRLRHAVQPGMAGLAMANYDYVDSLEAAQIRVEYDLYYIKHQSVWLDVSILARTLGQMLMLRGR